MDTMLTRSLRPTKPIPIVGHAHSAPPSEPPFVCATASTQKHHVPTEPPNLMGFIRFTSTPCSRKVHSEDAAESWASVLTLPCKSSSPKSNKVLWWTSLWEGNTPFKQNSPGGRVLIQKACRNLAEFFIPSLFCTPADFHILLECSLLLFLK